MKQLAIFDLDGTLLNTISDLGAACNYALSKQGFPEHPLSSYPYMVGNGVRKLIERAHAEGNKETIEALLVDFRQYYDEHCCDLTVPYEGISELLNELVRRNVAIAVASNKYQEAVEKIVKHFFPSIPFVAIKGQVSGRPVKPDPSIVFAILNEYPTPKQSVIYIGDSAVDIETARRACVESIGVTWGFRPVSELRKAYADRLVSNPAEILSLIGD
jgi:phosphoglycolate phosphatase